jgi:hypothetical protein
MMLQALLPSFSTIIFVTFVAIADILNCSLVKNDCKENAFKRKQQNTGNFFSTGFVSTFAQFIAEYLICFDF